ncbi:MAG: AAA family ATPase [Actinobacteria bacterium]|nr:AAA family ATPase [Actinomycetota bacterium]
MFLISNAAQTEPAAKSVGVVVVTSPGPGEGKTSTAANLAAAFAETGRQVLLVNADFRRPRISKFFMSERQLNALAQRKQEQSRSVKNTLISTKVRGVRLLDMSDVGGAPGKLARDSARAIASLRSSFDVVIVDTPPLSVSAEALEFISDATAVLVMARLGHTSIAAASRAADLLRYGGASNTVIGLSDTGSQAGAKYYGYYGYYNEKSAAKRSRFSRGKAAILADHRAVQEPEPRDEATDPWAGAHEAAWPQNDPSQQSR